MGWLSNNVTNSYAQRNIIFNIFCYGTKWSILLTAVGIDL